MPAMTLIEMSKHAADGGDMLRSGVIDLYAGSSGILERLPFINILGNAYTYNSRSKRPGVGFRGINQTFTADVGVINPQTETLTISGGTMDFDKFLVKTLGMEGRDSERTSKAEALGLLWTKKFIKGDSATDPLEFDGLQTRLGGGQLIPAGSTSGGDALSLTILDRLIDQVVRPTNLIMNKGMRRSLSAAARNTNVGGFITWELSAFGAQVATYNGLPIIEIDLDNEENEILPFTEANPGGGVAASTSIYCVSFTEQGVSGLQSSDGIMVDDLGLTDSGTIFRDIVEWYSTFGIFHGRGAARLNGIKDADVVV